MPASTMFTSELVDTSEYHGPLRESVGKLVGRYGRAYFQEVTRSGAKPTELWSEMGKAGFLGVHIPEQYGGGGSGLADYYVIVEEAAAQGCPLLSLVIQSICSPIIHRFGTDDLKAKWLPGLAQGTLRMSFAITEPDAGTNTHKVTTTARRDGDGWLLSGQKYWISAVDEADALMVVAREGDPVPGERSRLSLFIIPADSPGLTKQAIPAAVQTPETQFMLFFDQVRVGPEGLVGVAGEGLRQVFVGLNPERVSAAAINNGIARFALAKAAGYAGERSVWSSPIGAHQGVAHPLAEAYIHVQMARLMAARAAQLYDSGADAAEASNMAKFAAADASLMALDQAIQTHGGNGFAYETGLADLWFVARLHKTAPVSREMVLNHIAQHSLGLPKSY